LTLLPPGARILDVGAEEAIVNALPAHTIRAAEGMVDGID
jgi:hypothetical protein